MRSGWVSSSGIDSYSRTNADSRKIFSRASSPIVAFERKSQFKWAGFRSSKFQEDSNAVKSEGSAVDTASSWVEMPTRLQFHCVVSFDPQRTSDFWMLTLHFYLHTFASILNELWGRIQWGYEDLDREAQMCLDSSPINHANSFPAAGGMLQPRVGPLVSKCEHEHYS